jgi:GTP diphosphokinase / guanosine-3',5'-bis(diphosphate) 3'-diphosphatase
MSGSADQDVSSVLAATKFCAEKHRNQRRKDSESTPYINHPIEVAEILWRVGGVRDVKIIIAALLHDVIEDTNTEPEEIRQLFGDEVLSLILEVSDDKKLPRAVRKRLQIEHAPDLSLPARLIKIADKICNVWDLTSSPPVGWSIERKKEYIDWAEKVVDGLRGCNTPLVSYYDEIIQKGRRKLDSAVCETT